MDKVSLVNRYFAEEQRDFVYEFTVMLSDCDFFGHAGYSNYVRWQGLAVDALFLTDPRTKNFLENGNRIKVYHVGMQYRQGTVYGDNVIVKLNTSNVEPTGCHILFTFVLKGSGTLVGLGKQKIRFVDPKTGGPIKSPTEVVERILRPIEVNETNLLYRYE